MLLGFMLGFITAYVSSAAIVVFWSMWAGSALADRIEAQPRKSVEIEMDRMLFDELRCI